MKAHKSYGQLHNRDCLKPLLMRVMLVNKTTFPQRTILMNMVSFQARATRVKTISLTCTRANKPVIRPGKRLSLTLKKASISGNP